MTHLVLEEKDRETAK